MTDNKLKDNEIIKALEEYVKENEFEYFHSNTMGEYPLIRKALNLINRLQTQNKDLSETVHNLTIEKDALFDKSEELKAEVERLNALIKTKNKLIKGLDQSISYAYDRAIEEFAKRLKDSFFDNGYESPNVDFDYFVDNLVKEMIKE